MSFYLLFISVFILGMLLAKNDISKISDFQQNNDKPNVILIITNDQGYGELSFYGNPILKTSHLLLYCKQVQLHCIHILIMKTTSPFVGHII